MQFRILFSWALLLFLGFASCSGQGRSDQKERIATKKASTSPQPWTDTFAYPITADNAPTGITRTLIQDSAGTIWAATFDGVFRYDGQSFTNATDTISQSRFFSALERSTGELWFGTVGAGVYIYDGTNFRNLTAADGLFSNEVVAIYEDKRGDIWLGTNGGVSRYDGESFQNFMLQGDTLIEERTGLSFPEVKRPINEVNAIVEDDAGNYWLGTRGNTYVYDGKEFTIATYKGTPFTNVRTLIKDRHGTIWLGGKDGLWKYDGTRFQNVSDDFVNYLYEDNAGKVWASAQSAADNRWKLSPYEKQSPAATTTPTATTIESAYVGNKGMLFGMLEAHDGNIWVGALDGAYRYDGDTLSRMTGNTVKQ